MEKGDEFDPMNPSSKGYTDPSATASGLGEAD
jgi:hypothetical protein